MGKGKFAVLADCFDAEGQKQVMRSYVGFWVMGFSQSIGPDAAAYKAVFAKHGVKDVARKTGETDDQFIDRLVAQLKDTRAFIIDATPVAFPRPDHKGPIKGELKEVKIQTENLKSEGDLQRERIGVRTRQSRS